MLRQIKEWVMEQVLWAEKNLKGKTGAEKKAAVVQKVDDMIVLPWWLEWADGPLIGMLVDAACGLLNEAHGHDWQDVGTSEEERAVLAEKLPDIEETEEAE